jgi:hypothetical protein
LACPDSRGRFEGFGVVSSVKVGAEGAFEGVTCDVTRHALYLSRRMAHPSRIRAPIVALDGLLDGPEAMALKRWP